MNNVTALAQELTESFTYHFLVDLPQPSSRNTQQISLEENCNCSKIADEKGTNLDNLIDD